jgi:hypothetical protein
MRHPAYDEIADAKARRHEHVLWKFTITSLFVALGTFEIPLLNSGTGMSPAMLILAPFVAMAFDIYIFGEDYCIRRASSSVRNAPGQSGKSKGFEAAEHPLWHFFHDQGWEHLKANYPSRMGELFCCAITGFVLAVSCFALRLNNIPWQQILWFALGVVLLDLSILGASLMARARLAKHVVRTQHQEAPLKL